MYALHSWENVLKQPYNQTKVNDAYKICRNAFMKLRTLNVFVST
jgi:hypothetical protein